MKNLVTVLLLSLALPVMAGGPGPDEHKDQCYQKTVTVCPLKKPKKKKVVVAPPPKKEAPAVVTCPPPAEPRVVYVTKEIVKEVRVTAPAAPQEEGVVLYPRVALALGVIDPKNSPGAVGGFEVGARLRYKRIALDGYLDYPNGLGLQGLVYPVLGETFKWHLNVGALFTGGFTKLASAQDIKRNVDLTVGTGVEFNLTKRLVLTGDLRAAIPDPVYMANHSTPVMDANGNQVYGEAGSYIDVKKALANSFAQTQILVGLMWKL